MRFNWHRVVQGKVLAAIIHALDSCNHPYVGPRLHKGAGKIERTEARVHGSSLFANNT